jgi:hypothetical protein
MWMDNGNEWYVIVGSNRVMGAKMNFPWTILQNYLSIEILDGMIQTNVVEATKYILTKLCEYG